MKIRNLFLKTVICAVMLSITSFIGSTLKAEIKLPTIFGDNMILQQQTDASIWGWAKAGAQVRVKTSWNNKTYTIKSEQDGKWSVKVATPAAGGPYMISITDGKELMLNNVLIGEVWICSGQSNMEMPLIGFGNQPVNNSLDAIVKSRNKNIRLFTVERDYSPTPLTDCKGKWNEANPESVARFSATAYYFGRLINQVTDVPIGLVVVSWGGSSIKAWLSEDSLKPFGDKVALSKQEIETPNKSPAALYNAMLNPLIGYGIRGAIWYQGESDVYMPQQYSNYFETMINEWRNKWQLGEFPFYYSQIAPYETYSIHNSAFLREVQLKMMEKVPNSGMAVLMDSDSPDCIHPAKKKEVGERLAYWALSETYKVAGIPYKSPTLKNVTTEGRQMILTFENAPAGLTSYGKEIKGVRIAGKNKRWYQASVVLDEHRMYVFSPKVTEPIAVRYAFESHSEGEIFSNQGLPISSFRTDDWDR